MPDPESCRTKVHSYHTQQTGRLNIRRKIFFRQIESKAAKNFGVRTWICSFSIGAVGFQFDNSRLMGKPFPIWLASSGPRKAKGVIY